MKEKIDELYSRKKEIIGILKELYQEEFMWREISHEGIRNKTAHRKGKLQFERQKIRKKINTLKKEQNYIDFEIKKIKGGW
jgi:hypothetical protein